jgi:hypothetical protein
MDIDKKGKLIASIMVELKAANQYLNEGDTFLSLCFRTDQELLTIAKLSGINTNQATKG